MAEQKAPVSMPPPPALATVGGVSEEQKTKTVKVLAGGGKVTMTTTTVIRPVVRKDPYQLDPNNFSEWKMPLVIDAKTADVLFGKFSDDANRITYHQIFQKFCSGKTKIPKSSFNNIFRHQLDHYRSITVHHPKHQLVVDMTMLNVINQYMRTIEITPAKELHVHFDFGTAASKDGTLEFTLPSVHLHILKTIGIANDPYLVDAKNVVDKVDSQAVTFRMKPTVRFVFDEFGINRSYEDDVQVVKGLAFNCNIKTIIKTGMNQLEYQTQKPLLTVGSSGKPLVRDGHYVPRTSKMWLVLTVMGYNEVWLAAPDIYKTIEKPISSAAPTHRRVPSVVAPAPVPAP